jgi:hypothetical protein
MLLYIYIYKSKAASQPEHAMKIVKVLNDLCDVEKPKVHKTGGLGLHQPGRLDQWRHTASRLG